MIYAQLGVPDQITNSPYKWKPTNTLVAWVIKYAHGVETNNFTFVGNCGATAQAKYFFLGS